VNATAYATFAVIDDDDRVLGLLLPDVPDDAPGAVKEGVTRRRLVVVDGVCPCGARPVWPNRAARRRAVRAGVCPVVAVEHEPGCPATDVALDAAVRRWVR